MKEVKLLSLTSRSYLLVFLILLTMFFGFFYITLRRQVRHNVNETLRNRKNFIVRQFESRNTKMNQDLYAFTDFKIATLPGPLLKDKYSDTLIYEVTDNEWDEFRKLRTSFNYQGQNYLLEITKPHLESEEIIAVILFSLVILFILVLIVVYLTSWYLSLRLWNSFYHTLAQLRNFKVEKENQLQLESSPIREFNELNKSILELAERTQKTFTDQKQFIENASHETQTPLAIIRNQLELWIGDPELTEEQSKKIKIILDSAERLSKLNRTLLLMSKIGNQQFRDHEDINLAVLTEKILTHFEGQQESAQIKVERIIDQHFSVQANQDLLEILILNLVKNAFLHNIKGGSITIHITKGSFKITNQSASSGIPEEKLFQRFFKQSASKDSWGLGLAIAKNICDLSHWQLTYTFTDNFHTFTVLF